MNDSKKEKANDIHTNRSRPSRQEGKGSGRKVPPAPVTGRRQKKSLPDFLNRNSVHGRGPDHFHDPCYLGREGESSPSQRSPVSPSPL